MDERKAAERCAKYGLEVELGSKTVGVVWHTQGSGKSITMCCYAGKLLQQPQMNNPTLLVVTDRNDLDGQLFATFSAAKELLKQVATELVEKIRNSTTVDWQVREAVRAKLRILVRRILQKYKYPPGQAPQAVELILKQAEVLSNAWVG